MEVVQPRVPSIYEPHRRDNGLDGPRADTIRSTVAAAYDRRPSKQTPGVNHDLGRSNQTLPADQDRAISDSPVMPVVNPPPTVAAVYDGRPLDETSQDSPVMPVVNPPLTVAAVYDRRLSAEAMPPDDDRQPLNQTLPAVIDRRYSKAPPSLVAHQVPPAPSAIRPPLPSHAGGPRSSAPSSGPGKPAIQVSIGRVEVRAVFPEPVARRAPAPRSRPTVSLDEYLGNQRGKR